MTFLLMLVLIFFYIFAVTGVYFFEEYSRSTREDLEYNMFFSDLLNSLVTVFILFTLDHWYAVLQDIWKVPEASRIVSSIYIILWLLLGSIIFRNIIVAMMVTNFQNIRNELTEEMTHLEVQYKADIFKRQIIQRSASLYSNPTLFLKGSEQKVSEDLSELSEQESKTAAEEEVGESSSKTKESPSKAKKSPSSPSSSSASSFSPSSSKPEVDWETLVHENLHGLMDMDQDDQVVWPRDSLFRYFELLEQLQYNLEERQEVKYMGITHVTGEKEEDAHYSFGGGGGGPNSIYTCK
uniref:Ion transport domain-containing protein n=1 Tax=Castor canadensis TaxID=51338 RepID=A0A8C0VWT5_CASCN